MRQCKMSGWRATRVNGLFAAIFFIANASHAFAQPAPSPGRAHATDPATSPRSPAPSLNAAAADDDSTTILKLLSAVERAGKQVKSHQAIFHRREYNGGKLRPEETVRLRHQSRSGVVYMKWLDGPDKGRELLFTPKENTVAVTAMLMTLRLAPDNWLVRERSRHPISDVGIKKLTEIIAKDSRLAKERGYADVGYKLLGKQRHFRRATTCFESKTPKDKDARFYAYRSVVCIDDKNNLPIYVKVWDVDGGKLRMIEEVGYERLVVNPKLPPAAFTENFSEYDF